MPETRPTKLAETRPKHPHMKAATAKTTAAVRTRDAGHRKTRSSRYDTECEPKPTRRTSNNTIQTKPSETWSNPKPATCAPKPKTQTRALYEMNSHKAFTVFAPNPKKRQDIQQKAAAEMAALDDLRLNRAMGYISISPSTVGGCLTLEEVRAKQQKEMQMRRRQKQVKKYILEPSPAVQA